MMQSVSIQKMPRAAGESTLTMFLVCWQLVDSSSSAPVTGQRLNYLSSLKTVSINRSFGFFSI